MCLAAKNQNIKQKNIVTNSIKTLKIGPQQKNILKKKKKCLLTLPTTGFQDGPRKTL